MQPLLLIPHRFTRARWLAATMAHAMLSAEDEAYLAEHPAVRDVVQCIMYECLRKKPKDPIEHVRQYLGTRDLARSVSLTRA